MVFREDGTFVVGDSTRFAGSWCVAGVKNGNEVMIRTKLNATDSSFIDVGVYMTVFEDKENERMLHFSLYDESMPRRYEYYIKDSR